MYFRTSYQGNWQAFGGYFHIDASRNPFVSNSLTLKGEIGENFYLNLNGMDLTDASVCFDWTVTVNGVATPKTQTVSLADLEPISGGEYDGCFKVPVKVAAKEMKTPVTATVTVGGKTYTSTYSVSSYAQRILNDELSGTLAHYSELKALCEAMLIYGAKAQLQFGCDVNNLASNDSPDELSQAEIEELAENSLGTLPAGITIAGSSLLLKSDTVYRLYFSVADGSELLVTQNGEPLTAPEKGEFLYVDLENIAAMNILDTVTLSVNGVTCSFNPGDYITQVLTYSSDKTLITTVTALYRYCKAAETYFTAASTQP